MDTARLDHFCKPGAEPDEKASEFVYQ